MMKKLITAIIFLFIIGLNQILSQENQAIPLYKGKYPVVFRMFDNKVWSLFDSTHANGFVMVSFEISEKGVLENINFSINFPIVIKEIIASSLLSTNNNWQPAYQNQIPIRKRIIQPILYQYGGYQNFNFQIDKIEESFDFGRSDNNRKFIDAIILPICSTGFAIR